MKLLLPVLCVLSMTPAAASAAEKSKAPCVSREISAPYRMEFVTSPSVPAPPSYYQDFGISALNANVARLNEATNSRLSGKRICVPVREPSVAPTKLVRVTLGRNVVAWKAVPATAD
jgi:hypothetical protein